jgi:dihydrofolate reductase
MEKITTKEIIIIVAFQEVGRGFGYQGKLPWPNIPTDMEHFKKLTLGETVIMGRKTWESIPEKFRPLPERKNIIVSRTFNPKDLPMDTILATSLEHAVQAASTSKVFLGGGLDIYEKALEEKIVNTICATIIRGEKTFTCDRFFPELSSDWVLVHAENHADGKTGLELQFVTLKNKNNPFP